MPFSNTNRALAALSGWGFTMREQANAFGFDERVVTIGALKALMCSNRDAENRADYILDIQNSLDELGKGASEQRTWLGEHMQELRHETPKKWITSGSIGRLDHVSKMLKHLVQEKTV